ncbi:antibiotic biosynthesis monooxygenase family protein [Streptomyces sp. NPDC052396]|uniref:antibiotic biosynthesis monooxygenase family protein n=1 Tax=Streptomyces sp. NPDC052396 TaxID=3365689 RepID=UPI0037CED08B
MTQNATGLTVSIARFTIRPDLGGDNEEFEEVFPDHVKVFNEAEGALRLSFAAATAQDGQYLITSWWQDEDARRNLMGDPALFRNVGIRYFSIARHEKVNGSTVDGGFAEAAAGVLGLTRFAVEGDAEAALTETTAAVAALRSTDGLLADQLVRVRAEDEDDQDALYLLTWWRDAESFRAAAGAPALAGAEEFTVVREEATA